MAKHLYQTFLLIVGEKNKADTVRGKYPLLMPPALGNVSNHYNTFHKNSIVKKQLDSNDSQKVYTSHLHACECTVTYRCTLIGTSGLNILVLILQSLPFNVEGLLRHFFCQALSHNHYFPQSGEADSQSSV